LKDTGEKKLDVECSIYRCYFGGQKLLVNFGFSTKFGAKNFYKRDGKAPVPNRKFPGSFLETSRFTSSKKSRKFKV